MPHHVPALSPPLPSLLQDTAHTGGLRGVLTGSPGAPWGPGKPRGPGVPSFPRGPGGPRSPCGGAEGEGQAPRGLSPPVCEPALPCGASFEPSTGQVSHRQGLTLAPSRPSSPGRPCSPGGPGGPGGPLSPRGPASPVFPWRGRRRILNGGGLGWGACLRSTPPNYPPTGTQHWGNLWGPL